MTPEETTRAHIRRLQTEIAETPTTDKVARQRLRDELNRHRERLLTLMRDSSSADCA